ncbi:Uncharacterised protein [Serratia fonticola]|uniref:Uncharacterized protein n=1 Tax=Serratia fonticola TaxID=47917 RepID=A0A448SYR6_SERFO|nr:Uncharacterised protein [Serratia fonticola]
MAANVDYDFKNYFEIDEEKLRRIHSIVKKRLVIPTPKASFFT